MAPFNPEYNRPICLTMPEPALRFGRFTHYDLTVLDEICSRPEVAAMRSCDFTIGGIYLWVDFFQYRRAYAPDGTLFISGVSEDDVTIPAFSLPLGDTPIQESFEMLRHYCGVTGLPLRFSAIPESQVDSLAACGPCHLEELANWADYLYDAESLATLHGKHLNKKRNHVNRFIADNPAYTLTTLNESNLQAVRDFVATRPEGNEGSVMGEYEHHEASLLLNSFLHIPGMEGAVLTTDGSRVAAFAIGEVRGDTLHVHVEKINHSVSGAGETICRLFTARMLDRHPGLKYVNRQDDSGDEGLRQAKLSWRPNGYIRKFNVIF